ncbi:hypothetical protein GCM10010218_36620 [Streptomyces mashuensis]|uniref:Uncharacterized protein n=1 Tax=Streptomyces mashuensis TaxID=33904 RepID=A0A919B605_9ACTN|nr:hypothetical protein [Streptomyces mashuensis]GHF51663.1 hypothetical protein GCM10010218_36620 [Streptomyces mashuensis]
MPRSAALPNVPRWARLAATGAALSNVPSALWRVAVAAGVPVGLARSEYATMHVPGWGTLFLILLSLVSELFALLALGLVRPWGETWPRRLPFLGGRRVPVALATTLATAGTVATTVYGVLFVYTAFHAEMDATWWGTLLIDVTYAPLILWGPLLGVATYHYHRRRTAGSPRPGSNSRARRIQSVS